MGLQLQKQTQVYRHRPRNHVLPTRRADRILPGRTVKPAAKMQSLPPGIGKCSGGRSFLLHNKIIGHCKEPLAVLGNGHIQAIATRLRDTRQGEGLFPGLQGVHGQIIAVAAVPERGSVIYCGWPRWRALCRRTQPVRRSPDSQCWRQECCRALAPPHRRQFEVRMW